MRNMLEEPRSAAMISLILCLPLAIILSLILLGIKPHFGPLGSLLGTNDSRLGSIVVFSAVLLLPVAFIASITPVVRTVRTGKSILANAVNLLLAGTILILILAILGGIIVDQYPCWIGMPNCD